MTESIINNSLSPLELMEIYMAVITPRNNVPGYVDGPRREMKGWNNDCRARTVTRSCPAPHLSIASDTYILSLSKIVLCMLVFTDIIFICRKIHVIKWDDLV